MTRSEGRTLPRQRSLPPAGWLLLLIAAYFVVAFVLSLLRFDELSTGNWDLGIFQQAFWSTSHGHPLYEAGDYEMVGAGSLFEIHPAPFLVVLAGVYALAPAAPTLLALQAAAVALAAVPLYFIAMDVTGSSRRGLLVAGTYLLWPPLLGANLFDFHLEAFLPLELFTLFLLWRRGWYLGGVLVALLADATLEIAPILVGLVAIFFLLPPIRQSLQQFFEARRAPSAGSSWTALAVSYLRSVWTRPLRRWSALLLFSSLVAYVLLRFLEFHAGLVGLAPVAVSGNPAVASVPGGLNISLGHLPFDLPQKVGYWLLLYGLLAFIPLRALRSQIIILPWLLYTFVSSETYTVLGLHYALIAAMPLFIGFAYGLNGLELPSLGAAVAALRAPSGTPASDPVLSRARRFFSADRNSGPTAQALWTVIIVVALFACLFASPADPLVQRSGVGNGYDVSYVPAPGFPAVQTLASEVPSGATVLASDDLFPLVANDLHAYSLLWTSAVPPDLPFNATRLPTYVFISGSEWSSVPSWLQPLLLSGNTYHVLGTVNPAPQGAVTLYLEGPASSDVVVPFGLTGSSP